MNEQTATDLKIAVERIVRPIRACHARKLKMREELLGHLTAVFDEEHVHLGDEAVAVRQAVARFGDPAALTRELQQSVPVIDRLPLEFDPSKSALWNARRLWRVAVPVQLLVMFLALAVLAAVKPDVRGFAGGLPRVAGLLVAVVIPEFIGMWGSLHFVGALYGFFGLQRSIRRAGWLWAAYVLLVAVFFVVFLPYASLSIGPWDPVRWLTSPGVGVLALRLALPFALVAGVILPIVAMLEGRQLRRVHPWHLLELD